MLLRQFAATAALLALCAHAPLAGTSDALPPQLRSAGALGPAGGASDCTGAIVDFWSAQGTSAPYWLDCRGQAFACISAAEQPDGTELAVWWGRWPRSTVYVAEGGVWTLSGEPVTDCLAPTGQGQRADLRP